MKINNFSDFDKLLYNENSDRITSVRVVRKVKYFYKILPLNIYLKELDGYKIVSKYYPSSRLLYSKNTFRNGILVYKHENTIKNKSGLLFHLFQEYDCINAYFISILNLFKNIFLKTLKKDFGISSNIFFQHRLNRLYSYLPSSIIKKYENKKVQFNNNIYNIEVDNIRSEILHYFSKTRRTWCVISQCDPNDLNIGYKPIVFDYEAGGANPLMAEFATIVWYNIAQGNYLSLIYNKVAFAKYRKHNFKKIDNVIYKNGKLSHSIYNIRLDYILHYISYVIMPCFEKVSFSKNWYFDFKNYLAMKILTVFNFSHMKEKDIILSLIYLNIFYYNLEPKSPIELGENILNICGK